MRTVTLELPIINNLFHERKKELDRLISNLKIEQVKEDSVFENTVKNIKSKILLTAVTLGEPSVKGHTPLEKPRNSFQIELLGGAKQGNVIQVEFPFTGSKEMFAYMPENVSIPMGTVYQPSFNSLVVDVTLYGELNKDRAIGEANAEMNSTFAIVDGNNTQATQWSERQEPIIDSMAAQKRKELLDFYS